MLNPPSSPFSINRPHSGLQHTTLTVSPISGAIKEGAGLGVGIEDGVGVCVETSVDVGAGPLTGAQVRVGEGLDLGVGTGNGVGVRVATTDVNAKPSGVRVCVG